MLTKDVEQHNTAKDLYMIIHGKVYDLTRFLDEHPGGEEVLLELGGKDGTEAFEDIGHSQDARDVMEKMLVGTLEDAQDKAKKEPVEKVKQVPKRDFGFLYVMLPVIVAALVYYEFANAK
jgi:cytochrome b involved in lipid metabolism